MERLASPGSIRLTAATLRLVEGMVRVNALGPIPIEGPPDAVEDLGMHPLVDHCHLGLGRLCLKTGRREPARVEIASAIDLYHAMEMQFWLPQAEAARAQVSVG
jgi:hypothetical protein